MWKVPTLRNVALTAPYFHNGSVKTLDEAVRVMASVQLNKELDSTQTGDIVALNSPNRYCHGFHQPPGAPLWIGRWLVIPVVCGS